LMPSAVEFPFRGTTTVGELEAFYAIHIDAPPETTLDQLMRMALGSDQTAVDAVAEFEALRFRIQKLSRDGHIELVGMSILEDPADTEAEK
jgi:potassium/hydrogen antiporter